MEYKKITDERAYQDVLPQVSAGNPSKNVFSLP